LTIKERRFTVESIVADAIEEEGPVVVITDGSGKLPSLVNEKCEFCGRRKQLSRKSWRPISCVCCDAHKHQCRHRPRVGPPDFKDHEWPVVNPLTGKVERMTIAKQHELREQLEKESSHQ